MKLIFLICWVFITGCAQTFSDSSESAEGKSWDFDHQVQFEQYQISDNRYNLRIRSTTKTNFSRLSAFLVRQSFKICKNYGFKIEVVDGVETYNDEKYIKSYIPASLEANVECPIN